MDFLDGLMTCICTQCFVLMFLNVIVYRSNYERDKVVMLRLFVKRLSQLRLRLPPHAFNYCINVEFIDSSFCAMSLKSAFYSVLLLLIEDLISSVRVAHVYYRCKVIRFVICGNWWTKLVCECWEIWSSHIYFLNFCVAKVRLHDVYVFKINFENRK